MTPSARSANLIAGDGTKNGLSAPNKEAATNQNDYLTGKAPYKSYKPDHWNLNPSRIRIGFSVLVLPLFEPIRLAEEIATLDVLSEGRVDLGVSRGNTSRYFEAWGLDYEDRSAAFDSVFERLIHYWTEPKVEVGSRTELIEPKCVQRPHPPIYVATYREEGSAWTARHGLTLFQGSQQSVPEHPPLHRRLQGRGR